MMSIKQWVNTHQCWTGQRALVSPECCSARIANIACAVPMLRLSATGFIGIGMEYSGIVRDTGKNAIKN
jgi:hypothetical protein